MSARVFILATARKPELLPMATLVFKTLHIGFPHATVKVHYNGTDGADALEAVKNAAFTSRIDDTEVTAIDRTIHHKWIESLVAKEQEPFWILDTDVIFYDRMQDEYPGQPLAGCRIPEWRDEFSGSITRARLHTSLLYIDPKLVVEKWTAFRKSVPFTEFTPMANPIYPLVIAFKKQAFFYDTCSMLYHAIGGQSFLEREKDKLCHFNFGTISDMVLPRLAPKVAADWLTRQAEILSNPVLGKGEWRSQLAFYEARPV
jgi:hypothetical protein